MLIGGKVCSATASSPVISNAGNASSNPACGRCAPWVITTGASTRSPARAAARSTVRGTGQGRTASSATVAASSSAVAVAAVGSAGNSTGGAVRGATRPSATRTVAVDTPVWAAIRSKLRPVASSATIRAARAWVSLLARRGPGRSRTSASTPPSANAPTHRHNVA